MVLADDHPVVLSGLESLLSKRPEFRVIATVVDGASALRVTRSLKPDIAVLDQRMPQLTGIEVAQALKAQSSAAKLVLLTACLSDAQVALAVSLGISGVLMKDAAADDLIACLEAVGEGRRWIPESLAPRASKGPEHRPTDIARFELVLTRRERELAELVAEGLPNKMIARRLGLSDGTVKIHLHNVYGKLGVHNRTALAALALRSRPRI